MGLATAELIELLGVALDALGAAQGELAEMAKPEWSFAAPEKMLRQLEERDAMAETLKRAIGEDRALRERIQEIYREERAKSVRMDEIPGVPVDAGVLAAMSDAFEVLRRAALYDVAVREVLVEASWRSGEW